MKKVKKDLKNSVIDYPDIADFPQVDVLHESPEFPEDLTETSYKELGSLHSRYTAYLAYVNQKLAESRFRLKKIRLMFKTVKSQKLFLATGAFKAKQFAKVNCDIEVQELRKKILLREAELSVLTSHLWSIRGYLNAIKFEAERRRCAVQSERD